MALRYEPLVCPGGGYVEGSWKRKLSELTINMKETNNLIGWIQEQYGIGLVQKEGLGWAVLPVSDNLTFTFPATPARTWHDTPVAAALEYYVKEGEDFPEFLEALEKAVMELKRLHPCFELYWDYRDGLSEKNIQQALEDGNFYELEQELIDLNMDNLYHMRQSAARQLVEDIGVDPDHPCYDLLLGKATDRLEEEILDDANIKDLIRNSDSWGFVVIPNGVETYMEGWRGISELEEVSGICDFLNVSPHHLQGLVTPHDLILPTIPEREGQEAVDPPELYGMFLESIHGGNLCFMVSLDLRNWFLEGGMDTAGENGLIVCKGTDVTLHDYVNGATSCGFTTLTRDLVLPAASYEIRYDRSRRYGIQHCCDLPKSAWSGSVKPVTPTDEKVQHL